MPIFGQVWLWSSLAFLLGALLCWALVALPARRRVVELETELAGRFRPPTRTDRPAPRHRARAKEFEENGGAEQPAERPQPRLPERIAEGSAERIGERPLERPVPPLPEPPADRGEGRRPMLPPLPREPERAAGQSALPTREPGQSAWPSALGSGFGSPIRPYADDADVTSTELSDQPLVPPYRQSETDALARLEGRGWFDDEAAGKGEPLEAIRPLNAADLADLDTRLVDDAAETGSAPEEPGTVFTQHTSPIPSDLIRTLDDTGAAADTTSVITADAVSDEPADALVDDLADSGTETPIAEQTIETEPAAAPAVHDQTEVMPAVTESEPSDSSGPRHADDPKLTAGVTLSADTDLSPLPKRVPGKPRERAPFGVEVAAPDPGASSENEPTRALFEPIRAADDVPVVPPPHRIRGDGNGHGPFGPSSAMPLPGGGSPSPEFTIKASVSALRYCTPDSPQFGRTVAEVWFKTSADAERVGFRPVT